MRRNVISGILFLGFWIFSLFAQTYQGGYGDLFLARFPSPRGEALSGSMVAISNGLYSVYSNPALIVDSAAYSLAISTSQKYYFLIKQDIFSWVQAF
jgi:hypothetical protein